MTKLEELKEKVINGQLTILKVVDMNGKHLKNEYLDFEALLILLDVPNAEKMIDLITLYEQKEVVLDNKKYSVIAGYSLIAELIEQTAININDYETLVNIDYEIFDDYSKEIEKGLNNV